MSDLQKFINCLEIQKRLIAWLDNGGFDGKAKIILNYYAQYAALIMSHDDKFSYTDYRKLVQNIFTLLDYENADRFTCHLMYGRKITDDPLEQKISKWLQNCIVKKATPERMIKAQQTSFSPISPEILELEIEGLKDYQAAIQKQLDKKT